MWAERADQTVAFAEGGEQSFAAQAPNSCSAQEADIAQTGAI